MDRGTRYNWTWHQFASSQLGCEDSRRSIPEGRVLRNSVEDHMGHSFLWPEHGHIVPAEFIRGSHTM